MDTRKKNVIIGAVIGVVVIALGILACFGIFRDFNAQRYVTAILNQTLKGDVEVAVEMTDNSTEEKLYAQYEENISTFVKNSIISGIEVEPELEEKYVELCKKVFEAIPYEVQEAEKISNEEYHVPVTYQSSDIFKKFITSVAEETQRLQEKVDNGEYRGTLEEINLQMQEEFLNNSYTLFEEAYKTMVLGEEETMVFIVRKDENDLYAISENGIGEFITKIMCLDEIQD